MKYLFIDTETTGLSTKDEVIQFAALVTDEQFRLVGLENFYCDTVYPISEGAAKVNKLSTEIIHNFSKGLFFEDQFPAFVKEVGNDVCWIEWSKNGFDMRMINQTLAKCGQPKYDFGKQLVDYREATTGVCNFNLMHAIGNKFYGGGVRKLEVATKDLLKISKEKIDEVYNSKIKRFSIETGAHNADYDAFLCYLLFTNCLV